MPCTPLSSSFTIQPTHSHPVHITRTTATVDFLLSYTPRSSSPHSRCPMRGYRRRVGEPTSTPLLFTLTPRSHTKTHKAISIHSPLYTTHILQSFIRLHVRNVLLRHQRVLHDKHQENLSHTRQILNVIFASRTLTRTRAHTHTLHGLSRTHAHAYTHTHTFTRTHTHIHLRTSHTVMLSHTQRPHLEWLYEHDAQEASPSSPTLWGDNFVISRGREGVG